MDPAYLRPAASRHSDAGAAGLLTLAVIGGVFLLTASLIIPAFIGGMQTASGCMAPPASDGASSPQGPGGDAVPTRYLRLYQKAGTDYALDWTVLASVGKVETDHGRSRMVGVHSGENEAGAAGPMQFLRGTWKTYGLDGNRDGAKDRYDPADAIPAAAHYLKVHGAPQEMRKALWAYNHSWDYVDLVLAWSKRYGGPDLPIVPPAQNPACLNPGGPHPIGPAPSGVIGRIIAFAMAQRGKPYVWGAEGPDAYDCSGLIYAAYASAGVELPRTTFLQWPFGVRVLPGTEEPGDLIFFNSGPNSAPGSPGHVGLVIGKETMVVAPRTGTVVQTQSYKSRDDIQGFTRPLAHRTHHGQSRR